MIWPGHRFAFRIGAALLVPIGCPVAHAARPTVQQTPAEIVTFSYAAFIVEASQRFRIPTAWIRAVICAESFGQVRAESPKGAIGLMQIMPETWNGLRLRYGLGSDPFDAHDNIIAGVGYLRELLDRFGAPRFLAAYNAGPERLEDYLTTSRSLPAETRDYLARLIAILDGGTPHDAIMAARLRIGQTTLCRRRPRNRAGLRAITQPRSGPPLRSARKTCLSFESAGHGDWLLVTAALLRARNRRTGAVPIAICAAVSIVLLTLPVGNWALRPIEGRYSRSRWPEHVEDLAVHEWFGLMVYRLDHKAL